MKLVLRETVDQLGTIGDVVNVKPGFARNFLIPQGKAVPVTKENLRQLDSDKKRLLAEEADRKQTLTEHAEKIKEFSLTISMSANEEGVLYGAVTAQIIADGFTEEGIPVEARTVLLEKPIKELGVYVVTVRLHADIEVETKIWIVESDRIEGDEPLEESSGAAADAESDAAPAPHADEERPGGEEG